MGIKLQLHRSSWVSTEKTYTQYGFAFDVGSGSYEVRFRFPKMVEWIIPDEGQCVAVPEITARLENRFLGGPWLPGEDNGLPADANRRIEAIREKILTDLAAEYDRARITPVRQSTVDRYRAVAPEATVSEIRAAEDMAEYAAEEKVELSPAIALWAGRMTVARVDHDQLVSRLEGEIEVLEDRDDAEPTCNCEPEVDERSLGVGRAIERLRMYGASELAFRPGSNDIERVIDLVDELAAA